MLEIEITAVDQFHVVREFLMNQRAAFLVGTLSGIVVGGISVYAVFTPEKPAPDLGSVKVQPISNIHKTLESVATEIPMETPSRSIAIPNEQLEMELAIPDSENFGSEIPQRSRRGRFAMPNLRQERSSEIPKGWQQFEFNGMHYYIVPLSSSSKAEPESQSQQVCAKATLPAKVHSCAPQTVHSPLGNR